VVDHVETFETDLRSLDGLRLRGTVTVPSAERPQRCAVMVHGGGVTREEGGFFTRLAGGLAGAGISSLRFDLRAHGASEGRQEELTLSGVVNDIRAAVAHMTGVMSADRVSLIGASFGGGVCAFYASRYPDTLDSLTLLNPLLRYKRRLIDEKPYWHDDQIDQTAGQELTVNGYISHSPSFKLGRALLNELFYIEPHAVLHEVTTRTLVIHGTRDTFVPIQSSREHMTKITGPHELLEIEGAQHGFAVNDDPGYRDPQTQAWQARVIRAVADWIGRDG
jgi:uncharacterized protein